MNIQELKKKIRESWQAVAGVGKSKDCVKVTEEISLKLNAGGSFPQKPLHYLKSDTNWIGRQPVRGGYPTLEECHDASKRGLSNCDHVQLSGSVAASAPDYWLGINGKGYTFLYTLLPGMCIYTANAWSEKGGPKEGPSWRHRHMSMYGGDGEVYDWYSGQPGNWNPRSLVRGPKFNPNVHADPQKCFVGLAIFDPFAAIRSR